MPVSQDDDTATTNSLMTRSLGTTQTRFTELEEAIKKQNAAIKAHQEEFKQVNARFDELDTRLLQTMTFCKDSSDNILELRHETATSIRGMRQDAIDTMQHMILSLSNRLEEAMRSETSSEAEESDTMSCHSNETEKRRPGRSPRKKQDKRKRPPTDEHLDTIKTNLNPKPPPDQDKRAQYQENSTPDAGEE